MHGEAPANCEPNDNSNLVIDAKDSPDDQNMAKIRVGAIAFIFILNIGCSVLLCLVAYCKAMDRWKKIKMQGVPMATAYQAFNAAIKVPPTSRFQEALDGPELEDVQEGESLIFPLDAKWPLLLRYPVNTCGICVGLSSQVVLWRRLAEDPSAQWANIPIEISYALWYLTVVVLLIYSVVYFTKLGLYSCIVSREWKHPVRNNFFFAPFLAACSLATAAPKHIATDIHPAVFVVFSCPVFIIDLMIFGEWFCGKTRLLSVVANPTTNLAVSTNFVCANLGAVVGWKEPAKMFFFVGFAHYVTVFVTLYQQLPSTEKIPAHMHPVNFMFMSPPAAGGLAWLRISGTFNDFVEGFFWISIFLYACLVVRLREFWKIKFSLSWWAYTFPMTLVAVFSIKYANEFQNTATKVLSFTLSMLSSATIFYVSYYTLKRLIKRKLFPNDLPMAIDASKKL